MNGRLLVRRLDFFAGTAAPVALARATTYRFAERIGEEEWGRMRPTGRRLLRRQMRDASLEAVRFARENARCRVARDTMMISA